MARSITTPPGQDASPSLVTPPQFVSLLGFANDSLVPIYTPGWREALQELSVSPKNTTLQRPQPGLQPVPLDPGMGTLSMWPSPFYGLTLSPVLIQQCPFIHLGGKRHCRSIIL